MGLFEVGIEGRRCVGGLHRSTAEGREVSGMEKW